jgi:ComF family protein
MLKALFDIFFPPRCHLCKGFIPDADSLHLCSTCLEACRMVDEPFCLRCGIPFVADVGESHLCGACIGSRPAYEAARAAALFEGPVRELIHRFKYNRRVHHRRPLAEIALRRLSPFVLETSADLMVPVPLHVKRLRQRGFNQAVLIGELLARKWRLPLVRNNLRRVRWTEPQINLSASERVANVKDAFMVADPAQVKGRRIILLDDVYTTGSTVSECSRVLHRAGAKEVFVITIARALE